MSDLAATETSRARAWQTKGAKLAPRHIGAAVLSAVLLILAFPNFGLWPLAWCGLVPLLWLTVREKRGVWAFLYGWLAGTTFFLGSCYWLTYAMIRYGGIPSPVAYAALVPPGLVVGLFPALACLGVAKLAQRWGAKALWMAPVWWTACEWLRLETTGQLWNALGYSQAFIPQLIQPAAWGGIYAVSFLLVAVNAALAYLVLTPTRRAVSLAGSVLAGVGLLFACANWLSSKDIAANQTNEAAAVVIAVQPNVPMEIGLAETQTDALLRRHFALSRAELARRSADAPDAPRVVIWPESPMSFSYGRDAELQKELAKFTQENHTSLLFNSLEPNRIVPEGGYNAALMLDTNGNLAAQYDKIYLLPFGEYVPVPRWLPLLNMIPPMVGDFTPGTEYDVFALGQTRAAVFICFESAFPVLTRRFTQAGADVLVNIANDGYLGPTPVQRQHLANAVFRAVENGRPVLRVTNTGLTAHISARGAVSDMPPDFEPAVRSWIVAKSNGRTTFYTRYGDVWAIACLILSAFTVGWMVFTKK